MGDERTSRPVAAPNKVTSGRPSPGLPSAGSSSGGTDGERDRSPGRIKLYTFRGTPRRRGQAHGEELREEISRHLELWKEHCVKAVGLTPEAYLDRLYRDTDFITPAERYAPGLLEEVRGIAEGSGQDFRIVLARQLSDEEPWFRRSLKYEALLGGPLWAEHCSALAAGCEPGQPPIIAQNMDTPGYYRGFQILVRMQDPASEIEQYIFTIAGKLSLCGMNSRGVGICCNTLSQLDADPHGLAEDFIVRRVLEQPSLAEAVRFLQGVPHASGQNYVIGDPSGVADYECSARSVVPYPPDPKTGRLAHTNHPLVNEDQGQLRRAMEALHGQLDPDDEKRISRTTTCQRLATLESRMAAIPALDADSILELFSDRSAPLCLAEETHYTLGTLVMELEAGSPRLHAAQDLPAGGSMHTFTFDAGTTDREERRRQSTP